MAAAASGAPQRTRERSTPARQAGLKGDVQKVEGKAKPFLEFWQKINNDWIFNFSGTLAYGLLTSIFPILLVILSIGFLILGALSPDSKNQLISSIAGSLPGGAGGNGKAIVDVVVTRASQSAGPTLILGIVTALIGGSGLFITMESVFGVVFRLKSRDAIHQRIMAIGMLLIFAVLVPLMLLVASVPPIVLRALGIGDSNPIAAFFIQIVSLVVAFVVAAVFFGVIYIVVPNKKVQLNEVWKGTLAAAALLIVYELVFPIYESNFLHPGSYGTLFGFAVVIVIFLYYLAFILLLGAEVNSWAAGQRETAAPINAIMHEVQAHNTTRGAAGPTAGQPQEDLESGEGASAMRNTSSAIHHERDQHTGDTEPPKYAESGASQDSYRVTPDHGLSGKDQGAIPLGTLANDRDSNEGGAAGRPPASRPGEVHSGAIIADERPLTYSARLRQRREALDRPMTPTQRSALAALAAAGAVALTGAVQFARALLSTSRDRGGTPATD